jgi:putative ABC transport system permease protein
VYVLLALDIVIALLGIANSLSLAVHERTRELGLLRAVGQTRRQTRSMVRWESVVIAVFGTAAGVALGAALGTGIAASAALPVHGAGVTPAQAIAFLVAGSIAGVIAAARPARRSARLDILRALAVE